MNYRTWYYLFLSVILLSVFSYQLSAQDTTAVKNEVFSIGEGTILTGFSVDGITATRDDFNHEFERAFSRFRFNFDGLYFVNDHIGLGPIIGYEYVYRDFEDPTGFFDPNDRWNWSFLYGVKAGWYIPVKNLFVSDGLGKDSALHNTYLFVNVGANWLWSRQKTEDFGKFEPDNRLGYQLGGGLLIPVGKRISLEWKLGWEARRQNYRYRVIENGQVVEEFNETKWLKEFSVGLGLKVII